MSNSTENLENNKLSYYINIITKDSDPSHRLLEILVELENELINAAEIFEAVTGQIKINHYWIYYRMSQTYFHLGRDEACFWTAIAALQMEPTYTNWHMYQNIYKYFFKKSDYRNATETALRQIDHNPENPVISPAELDHVMSLAKITSDHTFNGGSRRYSHLIESSTNFKMNSQGRYGIHGQETQSFALNKLLDIKTRPEVNVWELEKAEIIIYDNNIIIFDCDGILQPDISVCSFPKVLEKKIRNPDIYDSLDKIDVASSIVISDRFSTANLCHFLYDHVTRLALYEAFCSLEECTVIGPSLVAEYQKYIINQIGIKNYHGSSERKVIRAERLFISETCKNTFVHPAHLASKWAISFLRQRFRLECSPVNESPARIYISRRDASFRYIKNEKNVFDRLKDAGFVEIALSDFDYGQQISLFANATHIVGMHGAGLSNIVFCQDGASVLEIYHPIGGSASYSAMSSGLNIKYSALIGRDAESDDPLYNDVAGFSLSHGMAGASASGNRNVIVDIGELSRWIEESGASK